MPKPKKAFFAAGVEPQQQTIAPANLDPKPEKKPTKIDMAIAMLRSTDGATLPDLMEATGWQAHSVRGAFAGMIKKKLGQAVTSDKTERGRVYRIVATPPKLGGIPAKQSTAQNADDRSQGEVA